MDEAIKHELRKALLGDSLSWEELIAHITPIFDRVLAEAEGRVHAQAIAAAAAEVLSVSWIPIHLRQDAIKLITRLTRPAAELRARIEVARARLDESKWWHGRIMAHEECSRRLEEEYPECRHFIASMNTLADLETKLAALDAKGGQSNESSH